ADRHTSSSDAPRSRARQDDAMRLQPVADWEGFCRICCGKSWDSPAFRPLQHTIASAVARGDTSTPWSTQELSMGRSRKAECTSVPVTSDGENSERLCAQCL